MAAETYSLKKNGTIRLSNNFRVYEFACKDGTDEVLIDRALIVLLQSIRDHFDKPVIITSAYRTKAHNAAVGGSATSQHLLGTAADIAIKGVTPIEICQYAEYRLGTSGGIGLYGTFAHVDVRPSRSRWDQRSGHLVIVGGFPGHAAEPQEPAPVDNMLVAVQCRCGKTIMQMPGIMIDGLAYGPVRQLCEALGHTVDFQPGIVTVK